MLCSKINWTTQMAVPQKLIELLDELIPGFAAEKYKKSLADMLWLSVDQEHRHRYYEKSITLQLRRCLERWQISKMRTEQTLAAISLSIALVTSLVIQKTITQTGMNQDRG